MSVAKLFEKPVKEFSALIYGLVQKSWAWSYSRNLMHAERAAIPVISVGALAIGGSGKTPLTILLAKRLYDLGFKPVICSRGYKGSYRGLYGLVSDGKSTGPLVDPDVCGDEPFLMASRLKHIPVIVAKKRINAIRKAIESFGCNIAVLDDGYQHLCLERDINIAILDSRNNVMFPIGSLREPLTALARANVIVSNSSKYQLNDQTRMLIRGKPFFLSHHLPEGLVQGLTDGILEASHFDGNQVVLVSAIANPDRFREMAKGLGWIVVEHFTYRDHYKLSNRELLKLISNARGLPLILTEKDWVKTPDWFQQRADTFALRIKVVLEDETGFWKYIRESLRRK